MEPWWNAEYSSLIGPMTGAAGGLIGGLSGGLGGYLASRGKAKRLIVGLYAVLAGAGLLALLVGLYAAVSGQPWPIWFVLVLPGAIFTAVYPPCLYALLRAYKLAEERRLAAEELRRS